MSISKASTLTALFILAMTLGGIVRLCNIYLLLREEIIFENNLTEIVKAGATDAQEDFRKSGTELVQAYTEENMLRAAEGSRELTADNERKALLNKAYYKYGGEEVGTVKRYERYNVKYNEDLYKVRAKNAERIYFFVFNSIYHNSQFCSNLETGSSKPGIYSSMEECALSGAYPCIKCVLGQ